MDEQLYKEIILDVYRNPLHKGSLDRFDVEKKGFNPLCGDDMYVQIAFDGEKIKEIAWFGSGCAISQAAASVVADDVIGKSVDTVFAMSEKDVYELLGFEVSYTRTKCAMLALTTIQSALKK